MPGFTDRHETVAGVDTVALVAQDGGHDGGFVTAEAHAHKLTHNGSIEIRQRARCHWRSRGGWDSVSASVSSSQPGVTGQLGKSDPLEGKWESEQGRMARNSGEVSKVGWQEIVGKRDKAGLAR